MGLPNEYRPRPGGAPESPPPSRVNQPLHGFEIVEIRERDSGQHGSESLVVLRLTRGGNRPHRASVKRVVHRNELVLRAVLEIPVPHFRENSARLPRTPFRYCRRIRDPRMNVHKAFSPTEARESYGTGSRRGSASAPAPTSRCQWSGCCIPVHSRTTRSRNPDTVSRRCRTDVPRLHVPVQSRAVHRSAECSFAPDRLSPSYPSSTPRLVGFPIIYTVRVSASLNNLGTDPLTREDFEKQRV